MTIFPHPTLTHQQVIARRGAPEDGRHNIADLVRRQHVLNHIAKVLAARHRVRDHRCPTKAKRKRVLLNLDRIQVRLKLGGNMIFGWNANSASSRT